MTDERASAAPTIAIWHGYLLGATGSNIYTHQLVDSWVRAGHDVVLACQEPDPSRHPLIHEVVRLRHDRATGVVDVADRAEVRELEAGHGRCTMVVPDIGGMLPVYVIDRYEGFDVRSIAGIDAEVLEAYCGDHAAAMGWVLEHHAPAGVLINHASPLPAALAPVLDAAGVPFAVKVHGSELEYALVHDSRLVDPAADALSRASAVLVGSGHIERRTRELLGDAAVEGRCHTIPPGVDLERFQPLVDDSGRAGAQQRLVSLLDARVSAADGGRGGEQRARVASLVANVDGDVAEARALVDRLASIATEYEERLVERGAADEVRVLDVNGGVRILVYVGKLIPQKGVQLLLCALPVILPRHPDVQLVVAGFGPLRDGLEAMLHAMSNRDVAALEALADGMGSLSGEGSEEMPHVRGWLDLLRSRGELDAWLDDAAAWQVHDRVTWLGLVDHEVLAELWPLAEASVVPSVLAEAFGMVAAEAAACGCVPVVADHSGLADAASVIELDGVDPVRFLIDETPGSAVEPLANALVARLDLPEAERRRQAAAARANVAASWGWDELARRIAVLVAGS